ncbi:hypothetical protein [Kineococcus rhizosphaerae]|uniref:Uncharacterized protein n=1 Tax=Kineococcus rhizosphaerae TaxID=559628 RepID=A0A2T0R826_9ACTN|nr:hypothetical protein [Kineococcus rhizosphaerae]PRY17274.1 hypothetical protein CLV37_102233 [Kineococcus rhizosphaerae]
MDLADVLDDLYGSPPVEFTATRDACARRARAEGDRDLAARIGGLRKPPVPAWAVNLLVRRAREEVEQLLQLGAAMREATASLAGSELREMSVQQGRVLDAVRVQAGRLTREAGVKLSLDAGEKVVATLRAAMSDPAAADAVRSGLLVRPLESTGFGGASGAVDLDGATATDAGVPRAGAGPVRRQPVPRDELKARREEKAARQAERERVEAERRERELAELREAVEAARTELDDARDEAGSTTADLSSARRRHDDLTRRRDDLRAKLDAVGEQLSSAGEALRAAERAAHGADERVAAAERELEHLRARLPD